MDVQTTRFTKKNRRGEKTAGSHTDKSKKKFIFETSSLKRWHIIISLFILVIIFTLFSAFVSGLSLHFNPVLPTWGTEEKNEFSTIYPSDNDSRRLSSFSEDESHKKFLENRIVNKEDFYAFYVNWDKNSERSLKNNIDQIDVLVPQWFSLNSNLELKSSVQKDIGDFAKKHHIKVLPLLTNESNGKWDEQTVHRLLQSPQEQSKLIHNLHRQIKENGYDGVNIDFENIKSSDRELLTDFMKKLYTAFHEDGLMVTMDVPPANKAFDYSHLEQYNDRMILMMYDEHFQSPGPIASFSWYQNNLSKSLKDKMIVSLGNYGYDWDEKSKQGGKVVSFEDVMRMAQKAHLNVEWDDKSKTPYVNYKDGTGTHELWFLDSVTFYNQWKAASSSGAKGVALWRLGTEDPSVWDVVKGHKVSEIQTVKNGEIAYNYGEGSILHAKTEASPGERRFAFDSKGFISGEEYTAMPQAPEIERLSKIFNKEIVLTFDDGPDPEYTEKILKILKAHDVKATFFMIGENAVFHQDIVKEVYKDGHEIGNHTFSHPNTINISKNQLKYEVNATERIIQGITGHSSILYRPPYGDNQNTYNGYDETVYDPASFQKMADTTKMGYITVNYDIDSSDWKAKNSKEIVNRVMKQAENGDIILLHDGGGNREATVEALPQIIEKLQARGYTFVTAGDLTNKSRESTMPAVLKAENPIIQNIKLILANIAALHTVFFVLFYGTLIVFTLRLLIVFYLALKHKRKADKLHFDASYQPLVSVVIAAYNEENVISRTIKSVLKSSYQNLEIIMVDDGSTDGTSKAVTEDFRDNDKFHLLRKKNGGKAAAINLGIQKAEGDIIVSIDADTIISPEAISLMVRHFNDEKVGAVSGNIKVGNVRNLLTTWQHIEYVSGFNLEKRAFSMLNCVTVVPGAIGAWRKKLVQELGYFTADTLAEDTDMSLRILRRGYKISIEEKASAYTEAPEKRKDFLKQRHRWNFGTLQCLWKHKRAFGGRKHKALGFMALPNMLLFQFIFPLFAPFLDLLFVLRLCTGDVKHSILLYGCYFIVDFLVCLVAFRLERISSKPLIALVIQRIVYRYLLLWVAWKAVLAALKGTRVGWNKLKRSGNLQVTRDSSAERTG